MKRPAPHTVVPALAVLGAAALAGAAVLAGVLAPRWADDAARADDRRRALLETVRARDTAVAPPAPATRPPTSLAAPSTRVAALLATASLHGLRVESVQQRWAGADSGALQVTLPLAGRYADVRRFIEAALRADPGLALDGLQLGRDTPDTPTLRADLQWTLHPVGPQPPPAPSLPAEQATSRPVPPSP